MDASSRLEASRTALDINAIRARDAATGATWFTGPASFTALAARDRRTLLAYVVELEKRLRDLRPLHL